MDQNKRYDQFVASIISNVIVESDRCSDIILWDFQEDCHADRLYFNVATIVADMYNKQMYVQMKLLDYLKLKRKVKQRKNLHWLTPAHAKRIPQENKTSVYILMDFIRVHFDEPTSIFKEINDEYYGWYK